jgi:hypothetical protein
MAFKHSLGIQVNRAASVLPQTVLTPGTAYYRVATGFVMVTGLLGVFTDAVGGAVNATWCYNPTSGVDTDFCAATALAGAVAEGYIMTVSGVVTETMLPLAGSAAQLMGGIVGGTKGLVFGPGDLGVFTNASTTGNWKWYLWYIPIDSGATVVAV